MTDFKGIRGWKVQTLSSDPAASIADTGSWASGADMNGPAREEMGAAGTQTSALAFGGQKSAAPNRSRAETEHYNGSAWTELADLNSARTSLNGAGAVYTLSLIHI